MIWRSVSIPFASSGVNGTQLILAEIALSRLTEDSEGTMGTVVEENL